MQLMLQFTAFNIQSHSSCAFDYLNVTDGDGTTLLGKACGSTLPANITSFSNVINLFFKTNADGTASGWSVSWSAVTPGVCQKLNEKFLVISKSCPKCLFRIVLPLCSHPAHSWSTLHCPWSLGLPLPT